MSGSTRSLQPGLYAHASGALWIDSSRTLVIADLHLGYGWAQRRKGELGPLADELTVEKLKTVCSHFGPQRVVFLGDVVHAPRPCPEERTYIETVLNGLSADLELVSVQGNHDRAFAREFHTLPVQVVREWRDSGLAAVHGDKPPAVAEANGILLLGHLHPSMPVKDVAGAGRRLPLFLAGTSAILLPAFSPFALGYNLLEGLPQEFARLMGEGPVLGFIASGTRVVPIGPFEEAIRRMYQADVSAPEVFRREVYRGKCRTQ